MQTSCAVGVVSFVRPKAVVAFEDRAVSTFCHWRNSKNHQGSARLSRQNPRQSLMQVADRAYVLFVARQYLGRCFTGGAGAMLRPFLFLDWHPKNRVAFPIRVERASIWRALLFGSAAAARAAAGVALEARAVAHQGEVSALAAGFALIAADARLGSQVGVARLHRNFRARHRHARVHD